MNMPKRLLILAAALLATALHAQDNWQTARVVAAESVQSYNLVAVEIGELRVAAIYTAFLEARQASTLTIGETVQARIDGQRLEVTMPSGKTVKAEIAQRAMRGVDTPLPSLSAAISADGVAAQYAVPAPIPAPAPTPVLVPPLVPPTRSVPDLIP